MRPATPADTSWSLPEAARLARLPVSRVRSYLRAGLVRPSRVDRNQPRFSESDLARLRQIRRLHEQLGLNAAGVEIVLRLVEELEASRGAGKQREGTRSRELTRQAKTMEGVATWRSI